MTKGNDKQQPESGRDFIVSILTLMLSGVSVVALALALWILDDIKDVVKNNTDVLQSHMLTSGHPVLESRVSALERWQERHGVSLGLKSNIDAKER